MQGVDPIDINIFALGVKIVVKRSMSNKKQQSRDQDDPLV